MASKSVEKRLAAQGENRDFATVLREWWSFDNHQRHTHSWHTREDFIDKELPKLLDDVRAQDANRYGYTHLAKPDDTHVRESLAGEGEAITEEWLRERFSELFDVFGVYRGGHFANIEIERSGRGEWGVYAVASVHAVSPSRKLLTYVTTRRQLLSLLSALGIDTRKKGE